MDQALTDTVSKATLHKVLNEQHQLWWASSIVPPEYQTHEYAVQYPALTMQHHNTVNRHVDNNVIVLVDNKLTKQLAICDIQHVTKQTWELSINW